MHLKHELTIRVGDMVFGDHELCCLVKAILLPNDRVSCHCSLHFCVINNNCRTSLVSWSNKLLHCLLWWFYEQLLTDGNPIANFQSRVSGNLLSSVIFWYRFSMCTRYCLSLWTTSNLLLNLHRAYFRLNSLAHVSKWKSQVPNGSKSLSYRA